MSKQRKKDKLLARRKVFEVRVCYRKVRTAVFLNLAVSAALISLFFLPMPRPYGRVGVFISIAVWNIFCALLWRFYEPQVVLRMSFEGVTYGDINTPWSQIRTAQLLSEGCEEPRILVKLQDSSEFEIEAGPLTHDIKVIYQQLQFRL